jgi:hypothetical protein
MNGAAEPRDKPHGGEDIVATRKAGRAAAACGHRNPPHRPHGVSCAHKNTYFTAWLKISQPFVGKLLRIRVIFISKHLSKL